MSFLDRLATVMDRVAVAVDPESALRRYGARTALGAVTEPVKGASKRDRNMRTFIPKLMSRDAENEGYAGGSIFLESPRQTVSLRANWLVRNNPLAKSGMESIRDNAIGTGLQLQCLPDSEVLGWNKDDALEWAQDTERRFNLWAMSPDCDIRRQSDFFAQQELALVTTWVKGDVFYLLPIDKKRPAHKQLTIQLVEPERVATPHKKPTMFGEGGIVAGVEKDSFGAPVAYWIAAEHPGNPNANRTRFDRYDAFDGRGQRKVHHVMLREAIEQTRGESRFQAVLDLFNDLGKYAEAELTAAIISAYFTVFAATKSGNTIPPLDFGDPDGQQSADLKKNELALGPGMVVEHDGDTEFTIANPNRPNSQFDPFVASVLKQIAVGIGLPMEVLLKHFTSSYSAARAEFQEAWKTYRRARGLVTRQFAQPVFEKWLELEVSSGRIKAPGFFTDPVKRAAYARTAWTGDQPGSLDPLKEANARRVDMETGVRTLDESCIEATGVGYWEKHNTHVQIASERKLAGLVTPGAQPVAAAAEDVAKEDEEDDKSKVGEKQDAPAQVVTINMPTTTTRIGTAKRNEDGSIAIEITEKAQ